MTETYTPPPHGWTCFHCGETFLPTGEGTIMAKRHFGFDVYATPGCIEKLTSPERSLLLRVRACQAENDRLRAEAEDEFGERRLKAQKVDRVDMSQST